MESRSRLRRFGEWAVTIVLSVSFLGAGIPKIDPGPAMVSRFEAWGYDGTFASVIGVVETVAGALTLVPQTRVIGAGLIALDMVGATVTHIRTGIGSPTTAIVYLLCAAFLVWLRVGRRDRGAAQTNP